MNFDFSKLKPQTKNNREVDPISLFRSLRVSDTSINDLWLAQGDALREWDARRAESDISIALNTGAGKTLVGLLIGQALVNELRSLVIYACSSIQLIEQTAKKAAGYGLPVTTYARGEFSNDLATKGEAICLTSYQALFNGKSRFRREDIGGIIFDDAHAAEHLLRDHFSLRVTKRDFPGAFAAIVGEFEEYFHNIGMASSYGEIIEDRSNRLVFVPPFEVKKVHTSILKCLRESGVDRPLNTAFAWEHLKDHIDLCAFIVSSTEVTITPPFVPVGALGYFSQDIRRIYLSATLSSMDVFIRTFGLKPSVQIAPTTTAGECERMIVVPGKIAGVTDEVLATETFIKPYKSLILTTSYQRAKVWDGFAEPPPPEHATEAIENFKTVAGSAKLLLVARYDGMDLPGDMCRVVVIDDLPSGIGPLERYLWEYLRLNNAIRTTVASRIAQSFGRISRGMSDHGVALVTGEQLVKWLLIPKNISSLPAFLQKQLQLGFQMSGQMANTVVASTIDSCLARDGGWVSAYEDFMKNATPEVTAADSDSAADLALAEARYAKDMWNRNYEKAAERLQGTLDAATEFSSGLAAWHKLWLGYALENLGDMDTARALYQQAHAAQRNIPRPDGGVSGDGHAEIAEQIVRAARLFEVTRDARVHVPRRLVSDLKYLNGTGTSNQTEEAIRCLGQYLGFEATRPDHEHGTGPDVLWLLAGGGALCMDAKTNKEESSVFRKEEIGQLADHVQWVRDNVGIADPLPALVGPQIGVSRSANPADNMALVTLDSLFQVGETLKAVYRDIAGQALPISVISVAATEFAKRNLVWPDLRRLLNPIDLKSLKSDSLET